MNCVISRHAWLGIVVVTMFASTSFAQEPASELQSVSVGSVHACGVHPSGSIYCWGSGRYGQLGNGVAADSESGPVRVQSSVRFRLVSAGATHSCALAVDGAAYCWGSDVSGVLGDGAATATCLGTPCSAVPVAAAARMRFDTLSAGYEHTCALRDGVAYCWGRNAEGQLGRAQSGEECGGVACGREALPVAAPVRFTAVSVRGRHSCALGAGSAYCWGDNSFGQLGAPATVKTSDTPVRVQAPVRFRSVTSSGLYSCALTQRGEVACWGEQPAGAHKEGDRGASLLFPGWKGPRFIAVGAGGTHSCALGADRAVYCWGVGAYNRLGTRPASQCGELPCGRVPVRVPLESRVAFLSVGGTSSCAIAVDRVSCWGGTASESAVAEGILASAAPFAP